MDNMAQFFAFLLGVYVYDNPQKDRKVFPGWWADDVSPIVSRLTLFYLFGGLLYL
jgi:hypothetical protein